MSEQLDRRERDFSKFDSMTTEALQQILRLDAMKPEGEESDTEELFYIMEVLADRRRNNSTYTGKTAQQAFEDFQKYYMPEVSGDDATNVAPAKQNKYSALLLRRIAAVAAALAIVFFTTATANAFGFDLFGYVAKWSEEFFHFESSPSTTIEPNNLNSDMTFDSLQQALDSYNISHRLAPTQLPQNYILTEIKVTDTPRENIFYSKYLNDKTGDTLSITIKQILIGNPFSIEKSDDLVEIYSIDGIAYYIFQNYDRLRAVWVVDEFECLISGNISIEEMKKIIDSI